MIFPMTSSQPRHYLILSVAMMTFLPLLINVSFKIISVQGMVFTASSVLCPLVACFYLLVLKGCSITQQRQVLHQSLLALYLFSIGVYLLVNLPSVDYVRDNMAYQIVFEDIPKKFFAATLAFGLSFYIPHLLCCSPHNAIFASPRKRLLLALFGGFSFFTLDFFLLFSDPRVPDFNQIYIDSLMIASGIMFSASILYLVGLLFGSRLRLLRRAVVPDYLLSPFYHYLLGFSVVITLICLACEYRLVSFNNGWTLPASGILSPFLLIASNLVGEIYDYRANLRLMFVVLLSELTFDILLMTTIILPSPAFFDLNPFYHFIMPRRITATTLALFVTLTCNAVLLKNLKESGYGGGNQSLRLFFANSISSSLLCLVNYSLLFAGIYPYEQIFSLAITSWFYKLVMVILGLPLVFWIYRFIMKRQSMALVGSRAGRA